MNTNLKWTGAVVEADYQFPLLVFCFIRSRGAQRSRGGQDGAVGFLTDAIGIVS